MRGMIIEAKNITKKFINVIALDKVNFSLKKNEIHGIVGQNGAGKSTLISILGGLIQANAGEIILDGEKAKIRNPQEARRLGISLVPQNILLSPYVSVAENIFLGNMLRRGLIVNLEKLYANSNKLIKNLGFKDIDVRRPINNLNTGQKQVVQIARALSQGSNHGSNMKVLILDEPSAILNPAETERLFEVLNGIKKLGISVIYISHYLDEVLLIADRITVLKDGRSFLPVENKNISKTDIINMMIGTHLKEIESYEKKFEESTRRKVVEVRNLSGINFDNVNFTINKGEILGILGLVGSGKTELVRTLFGIYPKKNGDIYLNGKLVNINSPSQAVRLGLGLLPEDRKTEGLFMEMNVRENITMTSLERVSRAGLINKRREIESSNEISKKLNIKAVSIDEVVKNLSGGNQQKVNFAKWMFRNSDILFLEDPLSGIDVASKAEVIKLIQELAKRGKTIVLISSEVSVALGLSDHILVMNKGKILGIFNREDATEDKLFHCLI